MNITEESILHRFIEQRRGFLLFSSPKKPGEEEFFASLQYLRNQLTKSGPDPVSGVHSSWPVSAKLTKRYDVPYN